MTAHLDILRERFPGQVALGVAEIAQCLNLSRDHIYRLSSQQRLPFPLLKGLGDKVQVSIVALATYLDGDIEPPKAPVAVRPEMVIKRAPGRPRNSTRISKLQLAFQSELKIAVIRHESAQAFAELEERLAALTYTDDSTSCAEKFEGVKNDSLGYVSEAKIALERSFLDILVPGGSAKKTRSGRL